MAGWAQRTRTWLCGVRLRGSKPTLILSIKLSLFPIQTYLETTLRHRFSDEWSRPGLTNFLGSVQCDADPTGLRHPIFPPVSGAEEWTAFLTINGTFLPSSGIEVDVQKERRQLRAKEDVSGQCKNDLHTSLGNTHAEVGRKGNDQKP